VKYYLNYNHREKAEGKCIKGKTYFPTTAEGGIQTHNISP
jgi:hypothetical protein